MEMRAGHGWVGLAVPQGRQASEFLASLGSGVSPDHLPSGSAAFPTLLKFVLLPACGEKDFEYEKSVVNPTVNPSNTDAWLIEIRSWILLVERS